VIGVDTSSKRVTVSIGALEEHTVKAVGVAFGFP